MKYTPPGGDRRYNYVPWGLLSIPDRMKASQIYPSYTEWIKDEDYWYPIRKDRRLAGARRWIGYERALELRNAWIVGKVHEE